MGVAARDHALRGPCDIIQEPVYVIPLGGGGTSGPKVELVSGGELADLLL
jgi:hypothetical protein